MKLNTQEPMEAYAVVYGYLAKTKGKVQTAPFNKIVTELGFDRVSQKALKDIAKEINESERLTGIVEEAIKGNLDLSDLKHYHTEEQTFPDGNPHKVITPYIVEHQRVLKNNREFNKTLREGSYLHILMEDLHRDLQADMKNLKLNGAESIPEFEVTKDNKLVVLVSDWHIGAQISDYYDHGGYNFEVLKGRLKKLLVEAKEMAQTNQVDEVICLFGGDMIEGADMRGGQKWGLEFSLSEQIARGSRVLANFLSSLETIAPVTFGAVRGNHDRLTGQANKQDTIHNDSSMLVILNYLLDLQSYGALPNTYIIDNTEDMYDLEVEVHGKVIHLNHGDMLKGKGSHFPKFIKDRPIDYLVTGHVHNFRVQQDHKDRMHLVIGSIMGYNDYSKELNLEHTAPNQTLMVMSKGKDPIIKTVYF